VLFVSTDVSPWRSEFGSGQRGVDENIRVRQRLAAAHTVSFDNPGSVQVGMPIDWPTEARRFLFVAPIIRQHAVSRWSNRNDANSI
jgi:hypothetical protein